MWPAHLTLYTLVYEKRGGYTPNMLCCSRGFNLGFPAIQYHPQLL